MIKRIVVIALLLVPFLMLSGCREKPLPPQRPQAVRLKSIVKEFIYDMHQEHGFYLESIGYDQFHDLEEVSIAFALRKRCSVFEARKLYVSAMEELLSRINADREIRPLLHVYPFTPSQVEMDLVFYEGEKFSKEGVAFMFLKQNCIFYEARSGDFGPFSTLNEETYQEALEIVNSEEGSS